MSHYLATLTLLSQLEVQPPSGKNPPTVVLHHNDTPVIANVPRWLIDRLNQAPPEVYKVNLHPKTDREGVLAPTSRLATWSELKATEEPARSTLSAKLSSSTVTRPSSSSGFTPIPRAT